MALETLDTTQQQSTGGQQQQASPIADLYQNVFNRAPDTEGLNYWQNAYETGTPLDQIKSAFQNSPEAQAKPYVNTLGGTGADTDKDFINPNPVVQQTGVTGATNAAEITGIYQDVLGRLPDQEGATYWQSQLDKGVPIEKIRAEIAASKEATTSPNVQTALPEESFNTAKTDLTTLLNATLGEEFVKQLTPEQIQQYATEFADPSFAIEKPGKLRQDQFDADWYAKQNPDVVASGRDPYEHYNQFGYSEGRLGSENANTLTDNDAKLRDIYSKIALDPVMGPKLKESNRLLYEAVTPIDLSKRLDVNSGPFKTHTTGDWGSIKIDGADVPILNATAGGLSLKPGEEISDFSKGRYLEITKDLGWNLGAASSKIARGAPALGVTAQRDEVGNVYGYTGLNEAADMLKIDKSQFKDKMAPTVLLKDELDGDGNVIRKAGAPVYETGEDGFIRDANGNLVQAQHQVSADQQLYDAINDASKDIYSVTGPNLQFSHEQQTERNPSAFQTVMYRQAGEKLMPITAPQTHFGMYNADVYDPTSGKGWGVSSGAITGVTMIAAMALTALTAGAAAPLTMGAIGGAITGGLATGMAATAIGGAVVGAALAAGTIAGSGGMVTGEKLLPGAVAGGAGAAMGPLLQSSDTISSAANSIASASNGVYTAADVSNIIGSTLANTLATAARGATGDQILKSFTNALVANGISTAAANGITKGLTGIDGFSPDGIAKVAKAGKMMASVASTAALTGKNPDQIMQSIIIQMTDPTKALGNVLSVANTTGVTGGTTPATTPTKTTQVSSAEYDGLVDAIGKDQADVFLAGLKDDTGTSPFAPVAAVGDTPLVKTPTGTVSVTNVKDIDPNAPTVKQQALTPEEETQYQKEIADADARVDQQQADKVGKVADALALPNADLETMISIIANTLGVSQSTAKIAANMAKNGATSAQISKALGTGTGVTGTTGPGASTGPGLDTGTGTTPGSGTGNTGSTVDIGTGPGGTAPGGTTPGGTGGGGTTPTKPTAVTNPFNYGKSAAEDTQGIYNLTPGLTKARTDYQLAGQFGMATGGAVATSQYDPFGLEKSSYGTSDSAGISDPSSSPFVGSSLKMPKLAVGVTKRNLDYNLPGVNPKFKAEGGTISGHNPQFFSEGGLGTLENRYVKGDGNGTSDEVPAMLANGEFVIPADVVSKLGNGSNDAGASVLDEFLAVIREHNQRHDPKKLPPDSQGPLAYLLEAKKRA